jgi:hypothetical protein
VRIHPPISVYLLSGFIPWDYDTDVGVFEEDLPTILGLRQELESRCGYILVDKFEVLEEFPRDFGFLGLAARLYYSQTNPTWIDIWTHARSVVVPPGREVRWDGWELESSEATTPSLSVFAGLSVVFASRIQEPCNSRMHVFEYGPRFDESEAPEDVIVPMTRVPFRGELRRQVMSWMECGCRVWTALIYPQGAPCLRQAAGRKCSSDRSG